MPRQALTGFTLVELMITIAVLAVLAAIALPSFQSTLERRQLVGAADNLFSDLQYARSEAIKRNKTIRFQVGETGADWCYGIDDESGADCSCASKECEVGDVKKNILAADYKNIQLTMGDVLEFSPRQGMPNTSQTFTFRIGDNGTQKSVIVNAVGNIRMN